MTDKPDWCAIIKRADESNSLGELAEVAMKWPLSLEAAEFLTSWKRNTGRSRSLTTLQNRVWLAKFKIHVKRERAKHTPNEAAIRRAVELLGTMPDGNELLPNVAKNVLRGGRPAVDLLIAEWGEDEILRIEIKDLENDHKDSGGS